jgi:hypothetical protein
LFSAVGTDLHAGGGFFLSLPQKTFTAKKKFDTRARAS